MPIAEFLPPDMDTPLFALVGEPATIQSELEYVTTKLIGAAAMNEITLREAQTVLHDLYMHPSTPYISSPWNEPVFLRALAIDNSYTEFTLIDQAVERTVSGVTSVDQYLRERAWLAANCERDVIFLNRDGVEVADVNMRPFTSESVLDIVELDDIPGLDKTGINAYTFQHELVTSDRGLPVLQRELSHRTFGILDEEDHFTPVVTLLNEALATTP